MPEDLIALAIMLDSTLVWKPSISQSNLILRITIIFFEPKVRLCITHHFPEIDRNLQKYFEFTSNWDRKLKSQLGKS